MHSPVRRDKVVRVLEMIVQGRDTELKRTPERTFNALMSSIRGIIFERLTQGYNPSPDRNPDEQYPPDKSVVRYFQRKFADRVRRTLE